MTSSTQIMGSTFFILIILWSGIDASKIDTKSAYCPYTRFDVVRIKAQNESQNKIMHDLIHTCKILDMELVEWIAPSRIGMPGLYMMRSHIAEYLLMEAKSKGLKAEIALNNVQNVTEPGFIDPTTKHQQFRQGYPSEQYTINEYHPLDEIYNYLGTLHDKYYRVCRVEQIGFSREGRPIRLLKIGTNLENAPVIFLDATMHAREWLSTATAVFIAKQLVTQYQTNPEIRALVDNITWYVLPVVNVDGYHYTWTVDRKWRQNRSPAQVCKGKTQNCVCPGTDLNRNWDNHWNLTGQCNHPCCETYPGSSAMSELEVQHESKIMKDLGNRLKAYISLHAYGQLWTYPYNHKKKAYPPDVRQLHHVAELAVKAVEKVNGAKYQVGTGADLLYTSSGCSTDWAKEKLGVKYSFLIELAPPMYDQKYGRGHFCPDSSIIAPTSQGIFAGVKVVADAVLGNIDFNTTNSAALNSSWRQGFTWGSKICMGIGLAMMQSIMMHLKNTS